MIIHVIFIFLHFLNMVYMNNEICGELSVPDCKSSDSFIAIENGRRNPAIISLNWMEFILSVYLILTEFYELYYEGYSKYFDNWTWNLNDLVMPLSFIAGFYYDHGSHANDWVRSFYTLTTMSLLFVFL